jgi:predicted unusual protein kinase regulating ubiquinone biosynthesis (AarF/ABC1/UbiB family)
MARDADKLPTGRVRRTAKVGAALAGAGVKGARGKHEEAAERMVRSIGQLKGGAAKIAQLASFIDTDFIPDEYRGIYQAELGKLRADAPAMPFADVAGVLEAEWDEPVSELFEDFEEEAVAAASIGQVHRAVLKPSPSEVREAGGRAVGRRVAVKIQYPGMAKALAADMSNARLILRLARALAPGLDAKAVAEELRERVLEELDYEIEAANQRAFARAYRGHPFIVVPDVVTPLSTERVLVTEWVDGVGFEQIKQLPQQEKDRFGEIVFRFCFGSIYHLQHFNADAHPGNYLLMGDGRVAFLDFGMTKRLETEQIELEIAAVQAAVDNDPQAVRDALADIGYIRRPERIDAEKLMRHVKAVGGWYLEDREITIDSDRVMTAMEAMTDPRSEFYDLVRQQSLPADELMGQRMQTGVLAVLGQLNATRNWMRIAQEWWFAAEPATELGVAEWDYFEAKGEKRVRKFALRGT